MTKEDSAAIYGRYAEARDRAEMTDAQVAKEADVKQSVLSEWKSGRYCPKFDKLFRVAKAVGITFDDLVGEAVR